MPTARGTWRVPSRHLRTCRGLTLNSRAMRCCEAERVERRGHQLVACFRVAGHPACSNLLRVPLARDPPRQGLTIVQRECRP